MVATILIGRSPVSSGLIGHILRLGDETDPDFARIVNAREVRAQAGSSWAQLSGAVAPTTSDGIVFKLSRHMIIPGQVWTWLGCYRHQTFVAGEREGTYVGCGLLALDGEIDTGTAIDWLMGRLDRLAALTGQSDTAWRSHVMSVVEVGDDPAFVSDVPAATPMRDTGLTPAGAGRLYIDLSHRSGKAYRDDLVRLLRLAQHDSEFNGYSEVIAGGTDRLRQSVDASKAYMQYRPGEVAPAPAAPSTALPAAPPTPPTPAPPDLPIMLSPPRQDTGYTGTDAMHELRRQMQSLQTRVDQMSHGFGVSAVPGGAGRRPAVKNTWLAGGIAAVIAVTAALLLILFWPHSPELPTPDTDPRAGNTFAPDSIVERPIENATPVATMQPCPNASVELVSRTLTPDEKSLIEAELACLAELKKTTATRADLLRNHIRTWSGD